MQEETRKRVIASCHGIEYHVNIVGRIATDTIRVAIPIGRVSTYVFVAG